MFDGEQRPLVAPNQYLSFRLTREDRPVSIIIRMRTNSTVGPCCDMQAIANDDSMLLMLTRVTQVWARK